VGSGWVVVAQFDHSVPGPDDGFHPGQAGVDAVGSQVIDPSVDLGSIWCFEVAVPADELLDGSDLLP
jgi:hypothetical protein